MSHYDRDANIAWLVLEGFDGGRVVGEQHSWGLIERDRDSGRVVAVEFWSASERLPAELLDALPSPAGTRAVVDAGAVTKRSVA